MSVVYKDSIAAPSQTSVSPTITLPATIAAGDQLVLFCSGFVNAAFGDGSPVFAHVSFSAPAGWTRLRTDTAGTNSSGGVFYKTAVAGDASAVISVPASAGSTVGTVDLIAVVLTGAKNSAPVTASAFANLLGTGSTLVAPAISVPPGLYEIIEFYALGPIENESGGTVTFGAVTATQHATRSGGSVAATVAEQSLTATATLTTPPGASAAFTRTGGTGTDGAIAYTVAVASENSPPNAATLVAPADSVTLDRGVTQRFSWGFSDPDPGDSQSAFDLRYSADGGATWTTVSGTTPNAFVDISAGTFADATSYEWQVRVYDSHGAVGPYSASRFFTAGTPAAGPTITTPTSGATIITSPSTVTWSFPTQQGYQVRRVADSSGSPDTSTLYYDTGEITDATTRSIDIPFETNGRFEHVQVRVLSGGLWSAWADVRVDVEYSSPPVPSITLTTVATTADEAPDSIDVGIVVPSPTGGEVPAVYVDVYRSEDGGATSERVATMLPTIVTWRDHTPASVASGIDYEYEVIAYAASGASTASEWTGAAIDGGSFTEDLADTLDGGSL